jgi:hypothetical protein
MADVRDRALRATDQLAATIAALRVHAHNLDIAYQQDLDQLRLKVQLLEKSSLDTSPLPHELPRATVILAPGMNL